MRTLMLGATAIIVAIGASAAVAQEGTVSGAAGGAVTGAIVGGPVGAAVGGVAGAALGTILSPPSSEVRQVIVEQPAPPSVAYEGQIVVGEPLPDTVIVQPVPGYQTYSYAVVNERRVVVDPNTRQVLEVID